MAAAMVAGAAMVAVMVAVRRQSGVVAMPV